MTVQLGLGGIRPDADDPQERAYKGCIPVDYCEDWSPPLRARPDDWIDSRDGKSARLAPFDVERPDTLNTVVIAGDSCEFVFCWKIGEFHLSLKDGALDGAPNVAWNRAHADDDHEMWCDNEADLIAALKEWSDEAPDGFAFAFYFDDWRAIALTGEGETLSFPIPDDLPAAVTDLISAQTDAATSGGGKPDRASEGAAARSAADSAEGLEGKTP